METELLSVARSADFLQYCMEHDLQILTHRREAHTLLRGALARASDRKVLQMSSDKFDKMMTYFQQNDQQVHYAAATNTVGVYSIVKLLGELRRRLRDYQFDHDEDVGLDLMSPRGDPRADASAAQGRVPPIDVRNMARHAPRSGASDSGAGEETEKVV